MTIVTDFENLRKYALQLEYRLNIVYSEVPPPYTEPPQECDCVLLEQSCPICRPAMFEKNMSVLEEEMPY